jgi:hypothetical protein
MISSRATPWLQRAGESDTIRSPSRLPYERTVFLAELEEDDVFYLGAGPIGAVLLGMALIPLRELTTASNLTFVFLALIILIAELGGRGAALATAVASAMSLNFFLTRPYLTLTIHSRDDILAFIGLAGCGLIVASFGGQGRRVRAAAARREHFLLHGIASQLELSGPLEPRLGRLLAASKEAFPLAAAVVRDGHGHVLAASDLTGGEKRVPTQIVNLETLLPAKTRISLPRRGLALPAEGVRLPLMVANAQVGWLDLWGSGERATPSTRRALGDVARLIGAMVAGASRGQDESLFKYS